MDNGQILAELQYLKSLLSKLIGTQDLPKSQQFSEEAINSAAKEFRKMAIQRGEWVSDNEMGKYLKKAGWRSGRFIREHFQFTAFIRQGQSWYYNKKALQALDKVLKKRNLNLDRYIEYKNDEGQFKKRLEKSKNFAAGKRRYVLPDDARDIKTSSIPAPDPALIKQELATLKDEFFQHKMAEYIDIYNGDHAMLKFMYHFEKYIKPEIKKRCKKWCENFNYANHALKLVTKKTQKFVPVREQDMIEL